MGFIFPFSLHLVLDKGGTKTIFWVEMNDERTVSGLDAWLKHWRLKGDTLKWSHIYLCSIAIACSGIDSCSSLKLQCQALSFQLELVLSPEFCLLSGSNIRYDISTSLWDYLRVEKENNMHYKDIRPLFLTILCNAF